MEEIIHKWTDKNLSNKTKIETTEGNIYAYIDIKDNFGNSIGYFKINTDRENFNQLHNGLDVIENSALLFLLFLSNNFPASVNTYPQKAFFIKKLNNKYLYSSSLSSVPSTKYFISIFLFSICILDRLNII